ncbi:Kelch domain protein [Blastocystis sp. ATCC 50177/Nand II]|uniref:Kelch domain protein n=1 Tax=Blastocystis sp. subtype 1 (strain ATCC 50177 / NandII) TaxID=478820 RepID=A0A196SHD7_BLAHN|nr:Kelch domain protein [Blastocystis sp. ATCC 50177/Nand II]
MKNTLLIALILSVAMSTITCETGQVYVSVIKKCTGWGNEESYKILSGSQVLVTSSPFAANEQRTDEYCLTASTNNQYTFNMHDSYQTTGDSWTNGAWASISGIYGNVIFKGFMVEKGDENFALSLYYPIMKTQEWKTFATTASIASDWNTVGFGDSNWTPATMGSAPAMTGTQYFRKTFAGIADMAAYEFDFNYRYGIIAYVNGVEIYRDHMAAGAVTPSSSSSGAFNAYEYHAVIRPASEVTVGNNVLAVELHFPSSGENAVEFDAFVAALASSNPITETDKCYVYPYPTTVTGTATYPARVIDWYKGDAATATAVPKTLIYELSGPLAVINGLRVWPSGSPTSAPGSFTLEASTGASTWSTVMEKSSQTYTSNKYKNFFSYFLYEAHNSYRMTITAIAGSSSLSIFELQPVVCNVLNPTSMTFEPSSYTYYAYYQNVDIHPTLAELSHCSIQPALPNGLTLDANTCTVTGKAMVTLPSTTFTMTSTMGTASIQGTFTLQVSECTGSFITAKKVGGGSSTASVTISVEICTGTKGLITLVVHMDSWPYEGSYKLHQGRGTSGQVVQSVTGFKVADGLNYGDFCHPYGIYTVEVLDSMGDGWDTPAGWWLTVDLGEMIIEVGQMPVDVESVTTAFSTQIPFQINYSDWKFSNDAAVADNWNAIDFDDSAWMSTKAAAMGSHVGTTAYIRHEVQIPSLEDYHVLNVRVKYVGGVAAYFNGHIVARFNLEDSFDASTEATTVHDASVFSKFHVILSTVGAVAGKNVMAFEVHRAAGQSDVVFDATGVFAVNECSVTVDTFSSIESSSVHTCTKEELFSLNPTIYGELDNEVGSYLAWTVENLEGSKWNSFALQTNEDVSSFGFSIYSRWEGDEFVSALAQTGQTMLDRTRSAWDMPIGIAGFTQFRYVVDTIASYAPSINAIVFQYCKPSGSGSCPAIGNYPSVGEGQVSPAKCAEGFRGYSYRECHDGVLGDVKNDKCEYKLPARLQYENNNMDFVMNTEVSSGIPSYKNIITRFFMQDSTPLPDGLTLNEQTGEITGKPIALMDTKAFTVRAENPAGETYVTITINVRKGHCQPEGVFERTDVGEIAEYQCAMQGSYVGTQKRACTLGKRDGEWQKATGFCMPVMAIVLIVVVVIVIIAVVVFLLMRTRSAKAVGGVKGKNTKTVKKAPAKKTATKAVKV